jgi:hypothetical protein
MHQCEHTYRVLIGLARLHVVAFACTILVPRSFVCLVVLDAMWVHSVWLGALVLEHHLNCVSDLLQTKKSS